MSILYVVPTPIGNLGDITLRSLEVLKNNTVFFCEDTRVTSKLFGLLTISTQGKAFYKNYEYNERKQVDFILEILKSGRDVVLLSDAGTPLLSDPGFPILRALIFAKDDQNLADVKIEILPGANSITTGLLNAGFPTDKFTYLGFFPRKPADLRKLLKNIRKSSDWLHVTYISFESSFRLLTDLKMMHEILGSKTFVSINKELTKLNQSRNFGNVADIIKLVETKKINPKGEIVLVFRLSDDFLH